MMQTWKRGPIGTISWLLLNALSLTGAVSIAWLLIKPGGWLFVAADWIVHEPPLGYYYLGAGLALLLAIKVWLDRSYPGAFANLLIAACAGAGTFFILRLLPLW